MSTVSPLQSRYVIVVIPTYNERESLPGTVDRLLSLPTDRLDVLVVDDNSPDGTGQLAQEMSVASNRVHVLHRAAKEGLGRAYAAGLTDALGRGADVVVQMDADGSHPPEAIPAMVAALVSSEAAVAVGSRYVAGGRADWGLRWHRWLLSTGANTYVRQVLRLPTRDLTAGFKAWDATALRLLDPASADSSGYSFQVEMAYRVGLAHLRSVEVPIHFTDRKEGRSKMTLSDQLESLAMPWRLRRSTWRPQPASEAHRTS